MEKDAIGEGLELEVGPKAALTNEGLFEHALHISGRVIYCFGILSSLIQGKSLLS